MIWTEERKQIARIACAGWRSTPHAHWMCRPGIGVDCIHFVVDVLEQCGLASKTAIPRYADNIGGRGALDKLVTEFSRTVNLDMVTDPYEFGDILIFNPKISVNHVALLIDEEVWHSIYGRGVGVYPLADFRRSIVGAMRIHE